MPCFTAARFVLFSGVLLFLPALNGLGAAQEPEASKVILIQMLSKVHEHLEKGDFGSASAYFVVPPNFKPEMLDGLIRLREISAAGVQQLAKEAKFGTGNEVFGAERTKQIADRAGVGTSNLYGFYHRTDEATAEVLAVWDGKGFKLIRLDDVGKLVALSSTDAETSDSPKAGDEGRSTGEAMAKNDAERRIRLSKAAATLGDLLKENPNDVITRVKYAQSLFRIGNTPGSWEQMMIAKQQAPNHDGLAKGMDVLIDAFTKQGIFIVGVPVETVVSLLGEPTQKHENETRLQYAYGHWAIDFIDGRVYQIIDLRGVSESHFSPQEIVDVDLDGEGRRCGFRQTNRSAVRACYYKPGESIAKFTEEFAVERQPSSVKGEIKDLAERMLANLKMLNPDVWSKVLAEDDNSVTIAIKIPDMSGDKNKDRHQLVRLLLGETDLHRITFTMMSKDDPNQATQKKWFKIVQTAKLLKPAELKQSIQGAPKAAKEN